MLTIAIAVTAFRRGEMWAWLAFWVWPVFFVIHGLAFFAFDFVYRFVGSADVGGDLPRFRTGAWRIAQSLCAT